MNYAMFMEEVFKHRFDNTQSILPDIYKLSYYKVLNSFINKQTSEILVIVLRQDKMYKAWCLYTKRRADKDAFSASINHNSSIKVKIDTIRMMRIISEVFIVS